MIWIRIRREQEGELWSAYCDELGLASCGATEAEAIANLKHAVMAYCKALSKLGILEKTLKEKGVDFEDISPKTPKAKRGRVVAGELSPVLVG